MASTQTLIRVQDLQRLYPVERGMFRQASSFVHAVDGISFEIAAGESLGLVGESGCGKTTTGKMLVKLVEPSSGSIQLRINENVINIAGLRGAELRHFRHNVQMVFQDPYESMNPRMTVYDIVSEPLAVQNSGTVTERERQVSDFLQLVGLTPPSSFMFRFSHELSGGQRQRVAIARALVLEPSFVVADEPTSMLDVSIRTGVMHLMQDIAQRLNVTYLYITHDLAVARYMCDRIAVMYLGKIVEMGATEQIMQNPQHPYTQALLSAVPNPDPRVARPDVQIKGQVSKPIDPEPRCRFFERCPLADDYCRDNDHPPLAEVGSGVRAACYKI
jgi:peptide/nickel transport system ATP-binding protein